jgi:hypothetical protein
MSDKHLTPNKAGSSLQTSTRYDIICSDYEIHCISPNEKVEDTK